MINNLKKANFKVEAFCSTPGKSFKIRSKCLYRPHGDFDLSPRSSASEIHHTQSTCDPDRHSKISGPKVKAFGSDRGIRVQARVALTLPEVPAA